MLGTGRPFYFEMINPKKVNLTQDQVAELEDRVNKEADGKIAVRYLQLSDKQDVRVLKDSASTKRKSYT